MLKYKLSAVFGDTGIEMDCGEIEMPVADAVARGVKVFGPQHETWPQPVPTGTLTQPYMALLHNKSDTGGTEKAIRVGWVRSGLTFSKNYPRPIDCTAATLEEGDVVELLVNSVVKATATAEAGPYNVDTLLSALFSQIKSPSFKGVSTLTLVGYGMDEIEVDCNGSPWADVVIRPPIVLQEDEWITVAKIPPGAAVLLNLADFPETPLFKPATTTGTYILHYLVTATA